MQSDEPDRTAIIAGYWHHFLREGPEPDVWFWAWERVDEAARRRDRDVVELLVELAEAAPDHLDALAYLGAGPIEDVLVEAPGWVVDEVDRAGQANERFRIALGYALLDDHLDPADLKRLRRSR